MPILTDPMSRRDLLFVCSTAGAGVCLGGGLAVALRPGRHPAALVADSVPVPLQLSGLRTVHNDPVPLTSRPSRLPEPPSAPRAVTSPVTTTRAQVALAYARAQLGKPYRWGATGPDAYDCSGLVQAAWRAAGVMLSRTTYEQMHDARHVARSAVAPGDLVFYDGGSHVALYAGGGRIIHAPHPGTDVRYAPFDSMPWAGCVRPGM